MTTSAGPLAADQFTLMGLVARSQQGDRAAFAAIYDATFDTVFRFARAISQSREDAEDVTAETFERALRGIGAYRWQGAGISAWLVGIARNVSRERARAPVTISASAGVYPMPVYSDQDTQVDIDDLRVALGHLSQAQREVLGLRLAGFKVREVATMLGKAEGTVKALQFAAMTKLRAP